MRLQRGLVVKISYYEFKINPHKRYTEYVFLRGRPQRLKYINVSFEVNQLKILYSLDVKII